MRCVCQSQRPLADDPLITGYPPLSSHAAAPLRCAPRTAASQQARLFAWVNPVSAYPVTELAAHTSVSCTKARIARGKTVRARRMAG
jgi:hypothetical protein